MPSRCIPVCFIKWNNRKNNKECVCLENFSIRHFNHFQLKLHQQIMNQFTVVCLLLFMDILMIWEKQLTSIYYHWFSSFSFLHIYFTRRNNLLEVRRGPKHDRIRLVEADLTVRNFVLFSFILFKKKKQTKFSNLDNFDKRFDSICN